MKNTSLRRKLFLSLTVQIIAGLNAGLLFTQLDNKLLAGFLASAGFLIFASTNYFLYINLSKKPLVFWANLAFLICAAGPLAFERYTDWHSAKLISVLGFDAGHFHKFSESFFLVVLAALLIDFLRDRIWTKK